MKLYSDFGPRRSRQVLADVIFISFIIGWALLGVAVYVLISGLATFGKQMEDAGATFRAKMTEIGDNLEAVVVLPDGIRAPFDGASDAGGALEAAGQSQQELIGVLSITLGMGVALLPILMIVTVWLATRGRFVRRAGHAKALIRAGAGIDLLALRALTNQKIATIAKVNVDAMGAWRRGDDDVMWKLAALELESSGIRLRV